MPATTTNGKARSSKKRSGKKRKTDRHPLLIGTKRQDPFDRMKKRLPVCPRWESEMVSDLFYDPREIIFCSGIVYILRFSKRMTYTRYGFAAEDVTTTQRAGYYCGYAENFTSFLARMTLHTKKPGHPFSAKIITAAHSQGITFTLCRAWFNVGRSYEKYLKTKRGGYASFDLLRNPKAFNNPRPAKVVPHLTYGYRNWQWWINENPAQDPLDEVFGPRTGKESDFNHWASPHKPLAE